ncbi:hypothetical protein ANN_05780, partial [Periplaneta americana]
ECHGLTFEDVKNAGSAAEFSPSELLTLGQQDLERSLLYLGRNPVTKEQASAVWKAIIKAYGDVSAIPDMVIQQLGWIAIGISPQDISNITLNEIDTIASLGKYHGLTLEQLSALAEQVLNSWSSKEPEDYTCFDLVALQHILCGFNRSAIDKIHPAAYSEASNTLGNLKNCPMDIMRGLAKLATSSAAFGSVESWTPVQVNAIGCVLSGLEPSSIASIPPRSLEYLAPETAQCIPPQLIK